MDTEEEYYKELAKTYKPYIPGRLYKYRTMESFGIEEVFSKNQIYLSTPADFNDPFDCKPFIRYPTDAGMIKRLLMEIRRGQFPDEYRIERRQEVDEVMKLGRNRIKEILSNACLNRMKKFGIYCLSGNYNSMPMWSYYAESHKGFCIEFDATKRSLFFETWKVKYSNKYPVLELKKVKHLREFFPLSLTKSNDWKHENEWRVVKLEGSGVYHFSPDCLTGVILGALMPEGDKKKIMDWIENRDLPVNLYQAQLHDTRFEVKIVRID